MKSLCSIFLLSLILNVSCSYEKRMTLPILPQPQFYEMHSGKLDLANQNIFVDGESVLSNPGIIALDSIEKIFNWEYNSNFAADSSEIELLLLLSDLDKISQAKKIPSKYHDNFISEGYCLKIFENKINIVACTDIGLFYGLQSLKQMLKVYAVNKALPEVSIVDYPHFKFRGMMDDISRGPIPNFEYMKLQVERLAELKYNYLMYYVEHVIKTKSHPEFAPEDALTIDEIKKLSEYAESYNIKLLGSFQSFGHFEKILAHPKYAHLGERETLLSPVLDESYKLLHDIYSEIIPAFNAPIFNVNCDETFDLGKGRSKEMVNKLGYAEVYRRHIMKLYSEVKSYNTRMMIWGDVVLKYPQILDNLPKDILIGTWDYGADIDMDAMTDPIIKKGFELLIIPGILNSNRLFPDYEMTLANANNVLKTEGKNNILGSLVTVWDDGGFALFGNDWYGLAYNSNIAWSFQSIDISKFNSLYCRTILNDELCTYTSGKSEFNKLLHLQPTYSLNDRVMKIPSIDTDKKLIGVSLEGWADVKEITSKADKILSSPAGQNHPHDLECLIFTNDVYKTFAKEKIVLSDYEKRRQINNPSMQVLVNDYKKLEEKLVKVWRYENRNHFLDSAKSLLKSRRETLERFLADSVADYNTTIDNGKFFLEWLVTKPIPLKQESDFYKNLFSESADEGSVQPKVTEEFMANGELNRWSRFISPLDAINVIELSKDGSFAAIFLYATIDSEKEREAVCSIKTEAKYLIYLNGLRKVETNTKLKLKAGKNHLLIKLYSKNPELLFSFNIRNAKIVNSKNRYRFL